MNISRTITKIAQRCFSSSCISNNSIPIIDFEAYGPGQSANKIDKEKCESLANQVIEAFSSIGFIYAKNHGISDETLQRAFSTAEDFFKSPYDNKINFTRPKDGSCGYSAEGRERLGIELNENAGTDWKECLDINLSQNPKWPSEKIRLHTSDVMKESLDLALRILYVIGVGLKLEDPMFFVKTINEGRKTHRNLRYNYYLPITDTTKLEANQIRCGEHTDFNCITILHQDTQGGLEVWSNETDSFIPATPIPGTIVVNIGDCIQRWTADQLKATVHRVVIPENELIKQQPRLSMAYFCHPDADCVVECIDGSNKYPPITADEHFRTRTARFSEY